MSSLLLTALWRASLAGGIALMVIGTLSFVVPRLPASWRCNLWRLAFLKTLAALFVVGSVRVPILPHTARFAREVAESARSTAVAFPEKYPPRAPRPVGAKTLALSQEPVSVPHIPLPEKPNVASSALPGKRFLVALYLLGVIGGLARILWAWTVVRGLLRRAHTIEHPSLEKLAAGLKLRRIPRLARSHEVPSPILVPGTILLPEEPDSFDHLLMAHELAHLKRGDLIWEWIGVLTQTIFWFHPLVWLARREERLVREEAADALALQVAAAPAADYARALLNVSLRRSGTTSLLGIGVFQKGSRLHRRLTAIAQPRLPRHKLLLLGIVAIVVTSLGLLPWRAVARQRAIPELPQSSAAATPVSRLTPPLRGIMSGLILSPAGKPVSGAEISWVVPYYDRAPIIARTVTNPKGEFVFQTAPGLSPTLDAKTLQSRWRSKLDGWVMVKAKGYGLGIRRVRFERRAFVLQLTPPQTYTAEFRDSRGKPVIGLFVMPRTLENGHSFFPLDWLGYAGKTNAQGILQVTGMPQGDNVQFDFEQLRWREVTRDSFDNETRTVFTLDTGYTLEGYLRYPDGRPAPRTFVTVLRKRNPNTYSNAQGYFKLQGMEPGANPIQLQFFGVHDFVGPDNLVVSIPEGQRQTRNDITLVPAARIVGRVTNIQGKPIKHLRIMGGKYFSNLGYTDDDGRYELSVPAGAIIVRVENLGSKTVQATPGKTTTLDFRLASSTTVAGEVRNIQGEPVAGAWVEIGKSALIQTDSQGRFRWQSQEKEGSTAGKLGVFVYQGTAGAYAEVSSGSDTRLELQISEKGVGHLIGRITDATGRSLSNVGISVSQQGRNTSFIRKNWLDAHGNFRIPVRPGARCIISFQAKGYGLRALPTLYSSVKHWSGITLNGAETKDLGQVVMLRGNATLSGTLRNMSDKPISKAQVLLLTNNSLWQTSTDDTGRFVIPGVVQGATGTLVVFKSPSEWTRKNIPMRDIGVIQLTEKDRNAPLTNL